MIDIIKNDAVEDIDLEGILQDLNDWQQSLGDRHRDLLTYDILDRVNEIINDHINVWGYK